MALATPDDLETWTGATVDNLDRALALLDAASAAVTSTIGYDPTRQERTVTVTPKGCRFQLRGHNVADVSAVDSGDVAVEVEHLGGYWWSAPSDSPITVTFTAGWDPVPADIVAVVCQAAARALGTDPTSTGVQQETAGPFSISYGGAAAAGPVGFLPGEHATLARYRRTARAITVGHWAENL